MKPSRIPKDFPVRPLTPGHVARDKVTCGACGLSWDDAIPTSYTPAPAARCPFEAFHPRPRITKRRAKPPVKRASRITELETALRAAFDFIEYMAGSGLAEVSEEANAYIERTGVTALVSAALNQEVSE